MRKSALAFLFCMGMAAAGAQATSGDAALDKRLATYMQLSRELNFEKVMDYIHPNLFKIAPREAILKSFEAAFKLEGMKLGFDSMQLQKTSAPFTHAGATYRRVDYYMSMHLLFTNADLYAEAGFKDAVLGSLQKSMAGKTVTFDAGSGKFMISGTDILFAIRDAQAPEWLFLGFKDDPQLLKRLLPQAVIAHFKLL